MRTDAALAPVLGELAARYPDRHGQARELFEIDVDRERARFGAWYELFPRSWGGFDGVERALAALAELGFDVALPAADPSDRA